MDSREGGKMGERERGEQCLGMNSVEAGGKRQVTYRNRMCDRRRSTGWIVGGGGSSAGRVGDSRSSDGERKLCRGVGGRWSR